MFSAVDVRLCKRLHLDAKAGESGPSSIRADLCQEVCGSDGRRAVQYLSNGSTRARRTVAQIIVDFGDRELG